MRAFLDPHADRALRPGNDDRESRPTTGDILGPHTAADGRQEPAGNGEAHPGPGRKLSRRMATIEPLEQMIQLTWVQAGTMIGDGHVETVRVRASLNRDLAIGG